MGLGVDGAPPILTRLGRHFDVVWVNPAKDWRVYWTKNGESFLEQQDFLEVTPGFTVMTLGRMMQTSSPSRVAMRNGWRG